MSILRHICVTLVVVHVVGQTDIRIPLLVNSSTGSMFANVSFSDPHSGSPIMMKVVSGSVSVVGAFEGDIDAEGIEISLGENSFRYSDEYLIFDGPDKDSELAVGLRSSLLRRTGSIALIRNASSVELVLNSSRSFFLSTCYPGSYFQFQFSFDERVGGFMTARSRSFPLGFFWLSNSPNQVVSVPNQLANDLADIIISSGGIRSFDDEWSFNNCTLPVLTALPELRLSLLTINSTFSDLVLYPEDYITLSNSTCHFLVLPDGDGSAIAFSPFLVPNINLRISNDGFWEVCDSM